MRLNKYLTQLTTRSTSVVSGQSFGSSGFRLAYITSMCSVQCFHGSHSLHLPFGSFFYPHPSPPLINLLNQCDGCLVPLTWGLMAGGRGFASHRGVTLSRGWLCQRWKPLDIPGTHLHSVMQLLMCHVQVNNTLLMVKTPFPNKIFIESGEGMLT